MGCSIYTAILTFIICKKVKNLQLNYSNEIIKKIRSPEI